MPRVRQLLSVIVFVIVFVVTLAIGWRTLAARLSVLSVFQTNHSNSILFDDPQTHPTGQHIRKRAAPSPHVLKIVAIGDIHGDMKNFKIVLRMADVVDDNGDWSGKINYFVQTGDLIDRGDDTIAIYGYIEALRTQAEAVGGVVVSLLGNHEYMNVIPQHRPGDVSLEEIASFGGKEERWKELTVGRIGTSWREHYKVACRLPLHPSIGPLNQDYNGDQSPLSHAAISFVHGGLPPDHPDLMLFPSRINEIGLSALKKLQLGRVNPDVPAKLSREEKSVAKYSTGPVWYRGWAHDPDAVVCAKVEQVLQKTGTRRMVMGHSAQLRGKGILSRCDGKIIVIDTGITSFFVENRGGLRSALSIEYTLTPLPEVAESADQQFWSEREVVVAIYDDHLTKTIANEERKVKGNFVLDQ